MTQPGETDGMSLPDHLRVLREHTGRDLFDYILVNAHAADAGADRVMRSDGADLIPCTVSPSLAGRARIVMADLLDTTSDHIRHDSGKLASMILDIVAARVFAARAHARPHTFVITRVITSGLAASSTPNSAKWSRKSRSSGT